MFKNERINNMLILVLIIFFIGSCLTAVELSAPPEQPCQEASKNNCADHKNKAGGIKTALILLGEFVHRNEGALTALATIAIAAFTGTLWFATKKMMEGGEHQIAIAKNTAEAAKDNATAGPGRERPHGAALLHVSLDTSSKAR